MDSKFPARLLSRASLVVVAIVFFMVGAVGAKKLYAAFVEKPKTFTTVQLFPQPKPMPGVMLRTAEGEAFPRDKFIGQWTLLFFGFTSCPDFCPMELHKLSRVLTYAEQEGARVNIIFVTLDPERDSAEQLGKYVKFFHPRIIGLRGDNPAIANLARFFGAGYERSAIINNKHIDIPAGAPMPLIAGDQYQVNHSTRIFLIDPEAQYVGSVANPETPEILWGDLQKLF